MRAGWLPARRQAGRAAPQHREPGPPRPERATAAARAGGAIPEQPVTLPGPGPPPAGTVGCSSGACPARGPSRPTGPGKALRRPAARGGGQRQPPPPAADRDPPADRARGGARRSPRRRFVLGGRPRASRWPSCAVTPAGGGGVRGLDFLVAVAAAAGPAAGERRGAGPRPRRPGSGEGGGGCLPRAPCSAPSEPRRGRPEPVRWGRAWPGAAGAGGGGAPLPGGAACRAAAGPDTANGARGARG